MGDKMTSDEPIWSSLAQVIVHCLSDSDSTSTNELLDTCCKFCWKYPSMQNPAKKAITQHVIKLMMIFKKSINNPSLL